MRIEQAVAVVTGGASGLGAATAQRLAARGARVAVLDLGQGGPPDEPHGAFFPVDVSVDEQVEAAVSSVVECFGRIDVLVNAAGVAPRGRIVNRARRPYSIEAFRRTIDINLVGAWNVARLCAFHMAGNDPNEGERGVIINVSSIAGLEGGAAQTAYAASKAAIVGLTLPMARDLGFWAIRVNTIAPGAMDTPILADAPPDYLESLRQSPVFPKRLGRPDEFAHLVEFLIENQVINGEVVRIDGGQRVTATE
jgi:3-hydroxyacyl-CoA dehydrogenase / 3-hydroxy-2-methylbutyryl-CoA dehydrogenase